MHLGDYVQGSVFHDFASSWNGLGNRGWARHTSAKGNERLPKSRGWETEEIIEQSSSKCGLQTRSIGITLGTC